MSFFDNLRRSAQEALLQSSCSFCGLQQSELGICDPCLSAIEPMGRSCMTCASPIEAGHITHKSLNDANSCGQCVKKPPAFDKVIAATRYKFPVDKALSELKFNKQLHYARSLSHVLERRIRLSYEDTPLPQALVAIPLHPKRLSERGFNQSDIITRHLSNSLGIQLSNALTRVKDTPHQIGLSEKQRRKNLNNAFYLRKSLPTHIALIDDVVTTGSTVSEAAKLCLNSGVKTVDVWCLAKT
ncbi:ComF family protein [Kangiella taiwanensis]|nr:ComF family protein [Kangiella taiwanensis]